MKETKQAAASSEVRAALHEVLAHFESFKAANDERLAAIEAKRADSLLEAKVDRISDALSHAEMRLSRLSHQAGRPVIEGAKDRPSEVKTAWQSYLRAGQHGIELKSGISSSSGSGVLAPTETETYIERRLAQSSPFRSMATIRTVGSSTFKKPVSTAQAISGWVAETDARPETDPASLDMLTFATGELYANPSVTQDILDDAYINLDEWLASEIEDVFAAQETAAFISGDGLNKPKGLLSYTKTANSTAIWGEIGYVPSGVASDFDSTDPVDSLIELIYAPKAQYRANAQFVMNRRTAAKIRKFKDADGNYIWQPASQGGQLPQLLGYHVQEIEVMPDVAANAFAVAFGDFAKGYLIVDRAGISVLRDPYSAKPYVLFYTTRRVGGGVQNFDAIKLLKIAAS